VQIHLAGGPRDVDVSVVICGDRRPRAGGIRYAKLIELGIRRAPTLPKIVRGVEVEMTGLHPRNVNAARSIIRQDRPISISLDGPCENVEPRVVGSPGFFEVRRAVEVDVRVSLAGILPRRVNIAALVA